MSSPEHVVRTSWIDATVALGGDRADALRSAEELIRGYGEPVRRYHGLEHVAFVLEQVGLLGAGELSQTDSAAVRAAAAAHDLVYRGRAGQDERDSADRAAGFLRRAGVAAALIDRVHSLVLATAEHRAPSGDVGAAILLDADLAVLARDAVGYGDYVAAVRSEYAHVGDEQWRTGRAAVLRDLLTRDPLYATPRGRDRWESAARANLIAELAAFTDGPAGG